MSLMMQEHLAHDVIERLGELGTVQFTDLNGDLTAFKRFYTPAIRRCDELEKKLRLFEEEMARYGVVTEDVSPGALATWRAIIAGWKTTRAVLNTFMPPLAKS